MVDAVIFDMDGVLIDAREWHFDALNQALNIFGFDISKQDHLERFDGLPTRVKLEILSAEKQLPRVLHKSINSIKQERTLRIAAEKCYPIPNVLSVVSNLSNQGVKLGVATNSIRQTTDLMLTYSAIRDFFDVIVTNEDVINPKPAPDIYLHACAALDVSPNNVLVVEDNEHGVRAAIAAGCNVHQVADPYSVHLDEILDLL